MATIPRIIHQVWFKVGNGPATPPKEYDEMRASWRRNHPDWTFMEWDHQRSRQLIQEHYPQYLGLFDGYKREIFRIDAIRYFILHHYGGFYVDTDVTSLKPIDELCRHKAVLALNKYTKSTVPINNNHFMACVPASELMQRCIERLPTASLVQTNKDSYLSTMLTAGPFFLTSVVSYYKRSRDIYILPYEKEAALLTHHEKHSWKLARSITGDVFRIGLVTGGAIATGVLLKTLVEQKTMRHPK